MSALTICPDGYLISSCRCPVTHPVRVVPCTHDGHAGVVRVTTQVREKAKKGQQRICDRCGDPRAMFRGLVCDWCADHLADMEEAELLCFAPT